MSIAIPWKHYEYEPYKKPIPYVPTRGRRRPSRQGQVTYIQVTCYRGMQRVICIKTPLPPWPLTGLFGENLKSSAPQPNNDFDNDELLALIFI